MAQLHPSCPLGVPTTLGGFAERDVLLRLEAGLPAGFDIFHNIAWSNMHEGVQGFGEYDVVIVAPAGQVLLLEVKAGDVEEREDGLFKHYPGEPPKDIGRQVRRMHASLMSRIKGGELASVHVGSMLVLPDHRVRGPVAAYPAERIVDAAGMDQLCSRVLASFPGEGVAAAQREQWLRFLSNQFDVQPDVATHVGQLRQASTRMASGLATWMPRVSHPDQVYVVEATAGSGKTQLALALLRDAAGRRQRARYVCFNRPLADHLAQVAPAQCDVSTFHQLCRDHWEQHVGPADFSDPEVFDGMAQRFLADAPSMAARLDLLVLDESQDFDPAWVLALVGLLAPGGRLYLMGDPDQQIYPRDPFGLDMAVTVRCMDNFRSPRCIVDLVNLLQLTASPVVWRSPGVGEAPGVHEWSGGPAQSLAAVERALARLRADGFAPEQVAVLSFNGVQHAQVLKLDRLAGMAVKRSSGYDAAGNVKLTRGELLVESVYRFKGQSAPAVVLCEVDFEQLGEKEKRKLFVGLTRAQVRVELALSERAARVLAAAAGA